MANKDFKTTSEEFDRILQFIISNKDSIINSEPLDDRKSDYDRYITKTQKLRGIMEYHRSLDAPVVTTPSLSFSFTIFKSKEL